MTSAAMVKRDPLYTAEVDGALGLLAWAKGSQANGLSIESDLDCREIEAASKG